MLYLGSDDVAPSNSVNRGSGSPSRYKPSRRQLTPSDATITDGWRKGGNSGTADGKPADVAGYFGFSQAIEVSGAQHTIFCTDHRSTDAEGSPVHPEDMRAQISQAMDTLRRSRSWLLAH